MQEIRKEIPDYADPIYKSPPKPTEISTQVTPKKIMNSDIDAFEQDINSDFQRKLPISRRCDIRNIPKAR